MSLRDTFNQAAEEWKRHCLKNAFHSTSHPYLDCDAYKKITTMGPKILPFIREEYAKPQKIGDPGIYWCYALKEIVPEFSLPVGERNSNSPIELICCGFVGLKVSEVQKATIKWLDENMNKYTERQHTP